MLTSSNPPSEKVVGWPSWNGMPAVVVRDPANGGLTASSSVEPGKRWRIVNVLDVLSERRKFSESDWNSVFVRWFTDS